MPPVPPPLPVDKDIEMEEVPIAEKPPSEKVIKSPILSKKLPSTKPLLLVETPQLPLQGNARVPEDIYVGLPKSKGKKPRASPAFKFSSAAQENVNQDELLDRLLDSPITLSLKEVLSSFEIAKRMQTITKSQKIPTNKTTDPQPKKSRSTYLEELGDKGSASQEVHVR